MAGTLDIILNRGRDSSAASVALNPVRSANRSERIVNSTKEVQLGIDSVSDGLNGSEPGSSRHGLAEQMN